MGNFLCGLFGKKKEEQKDQTLLKNQSSYGLSVWYEPADEDTIQFDIVFVHGLTGNSTSTWRAAGANQPWPQTKLPKSFKHARVMTFGYDADIVRTLGRVSQNTFMDHASNLLNYLRNKRRKPKMDTRPLMFVAHSLGGLVCEKTLVLCNQHPEDEVKNIWTSTFGLIFMGTPQLGSDLSVIAGRLARIINLDPTRKVNHKLLEVLRRDSTEQADMQNAFGALVANRNRLPGSLAVYDFAEELPVILLGQVVVTTQSSRFRAGFSDFSTIHADHMQMTKIQESDDNAYDMFVGVIQRWVEPFAPVSEDDCRLGTEKFYSYPERIKHFQPREKLLLGLEEAMATKQIGPTNSTRTVVLQGLGGSGKTQLALEYCARCKSQKTVWAIFWAHALSKASLENSFDGIWDTIRPSQMIQNSETIASKILSVKQTLSSWARPWLLVFDNYDDLVGFPRIMEFVPQSEFGRILFTSRLRGLSRRDGFDYEIPVGGLEEREAIDMLLSRSRIIQDPTPAKESDAKIVVDRLGKLPLAIDQAAAYILLTEDTLDNFTKNFDSMKANVLNILSNNSSYIQSTNDGQEKQLSICTTWELSFNLIKDEIPRTQQIKGYVLTLLAYLDARNISDEIFAQPFTTSDSRSERLLREGLMSSLEESFMKRGRIWDMNAIYPLIGELNSLSLIQQFRRTEDSKHRIFSLHPLVQDWLKIRGKDVDREQCFVLAVCLLYGCVAAHKRSSAGQQMSMSAESQIQILRHLEALDADTRLRIESARPGNLFETLQPVIQQMSQTMSSIRAERLRQLMREVGRWLSELNPYDYHQSIVDRAVPGTGSSVLDCHKFQEWTASRGPDSVLWLIGSPTTGKTFATAVIISYLENVFLERNRSSSSVIFFYFRDGTDSSALLREIFGNLLKLLLSSQDTQTLLDDEVTNIRKLYEQHRAGVMIDELPAILTILSQGVSKLENCYIVLDGLHICPVDVMEDLFSKLTPLLHMPCVKLMMTSRSIPMLRDNLTSFGGQTIDFDPGDTPSPEKRDYIHKHISGWAMKQNLKDMVENFVWRQSHKSFLYLRLLLDELEGIRSEEDFDEQVAALPATLDEFLERRLSPVLEANPEIRQHGLLMIAWVLCAQAPVSLTALLPIFYPDLEVGDLAGGVSYFQHITGNLIIFHEAVGVPRFTHSSVKEYLEASRSGRIWASYRSPMGGRWVSNPRFISLPGPNTGVRNLPYDHASFAIECIKQLSKEVLDFGPDGPSLQQAQTLSFECEFLKYAAVYWGVHVRLYHEDVGIQDSPDAKFQELTESAVSFLTDEPKLKTSLVIAQYLHESGENKGNPLAKLAPESKALDVVVAFKLPEIIKERLSEAHAEP